MRIFLILAVVLSISSVQAQTLEGSVKKEALEGNVSSQVLEGSITRLENYVDDDHKLHTINWNRWIENLVNEHGRLFNQYRNATDAFYPNDCIRQWITAYKDGSLKVMTSENAIPWSGFKLYSDICWQRLEHTKATRWPEYSQRERIIFTVKHDMVGPGGYHLKGREEYVIK